MTVGNLTASGRAELRGTSSGPARPELAAAARVLKFFGLVCGLALLWAGAAWAQSEADLKLMEAFAREPQLAQKDVDAYLEAFPLLKQPGTGQSRVAEVFEKAGLSEVRGLYVVAKISQAYAVLEFEKELGLEAAESYRDSLEDAYKPSTDEVALVRQNKDKLDAALASW